MVYDLLIIGAGPAGLTATIYASRYRLKNLTIGEKLGGTITLANKLENYPGFKTISGLKWAGLTKQQIHYLGGQIILDKVTKIEKRNNPKPSFKIYTSQKTFQSKTIIIATGTQRKKLKIPGEEKYHGRGVSYCTTCDAPFFKGKTVALIGGSDAAVSGAVHTAEFAKKVYIIYRKDKLRAEPIWIEQALNNPKIVPIYNTNITKIKGTKNKINKVTAVTLDNPYQGKKTLSLDGVFIEIGAVPGTALCQDLSVKLDDKGYVAVNSLMQTNVKGVFSAGDITATNANLKQMIIACAQGAIAAASCYKYLKKEKAPQIIGI